METHTLIREIRKRLKLTEQQLAERVGVSRAAVQQWERGTTAPKRSHQDSLATALGITKAQLLGMQPDEKVAHIPIATLELAMATLSQYLLMIPESDRPAAAATLSALTQTPGDHARKAAILRLLMQQETTSEQTATGTHNIPE